VVLNLALQPEQGGNTPELVNAEWSLKQLNYHGVLFVENHCKKYCFKEYFLELRQ